MVSGNNMNPNYPKRVYCSWLKLRFCAYYRFSVSNDLKYDAERDLRDIGAKNIQVHALNKVMNTSF